MSQSLDLRKAFTFMFDDPQWLGKAVICGLVTLVPILNFAAYGYETRVARNVWRREAQPLPTWDDFSGTFTDGLQIGLARIVLSLPLFVFLFIPMFAMFFFLPFATLFLIDPDNPSPNSETWAALLGGGGFLVGGVLIVLAIVFGLFLGFILPAMTANFARQRTFAACFDRAEITRFIRENGNAYIQAWVAGLGAGLVVAVALWFSYLIPCLGWLLSLPLTGLGVFYVLMVMAHAVGQVMALDEARRGSVAAGLAVAA